MSSSRMNPRVRHACTLPGMAYHRRCNQTPNDEVTARALPIPKPHHPRSHPGRFAQHKVDGWQPTAMVTELETVVPAAANLGRLPEYPHTTQERVACPTNRAETGNQGSGDPAATSGSYLLIEVTAKFVSLLLAAFSWSRISLRRTWASSFPKTFAHSRREP